MTWSSRVAASLVLVAVAAAASGCAEGLEFRQRHRVEITQPAERADVRLPLTIAWRVTDAGLAGSQPRFAVFVDRAPVPAGESLAWVARNDRLCQLPACPDKAYLERNDVYETTSTSVTLAALRDLDRAGSTETHVATVVLLGSDGRRLGEEAYRVQFRIRRPR